MKNELQIVTISCFPARRQKTELTGIGAQKNQPVDNDWASTLIVLMRNWEENGNSRSFGWHWSISMSLANGSRCERFNLSACVLRKTLEMRDTKNLSTRAFRRKTKFVVIPRIFVFVLSFLQGKLSYFFSKWLLWRRRMEQQRFIGRAAERQSINRRRQALYLSVC